MKFKSSYFIMAYDMLSKDKRKWTSWDFNDIFRVDILSFFQLLIDKEILERKYRSGRNSYSVLKDPEKLLQVCIEGFGDNERKVIKFISRKENDEILKGLQVGKIQFYLGQFSGISEELSYVFDNNLSVIIPDRKYFEGRKLSEIQFDLGIGKVRIGEQIQFIYPRYRRFLEYKGMTNGKGYQIPSNFYSFLYAAATKNPMGQPQMEYMTGKLKGKHGEFLFWK